MLLRMRDTLLVRVLILIYLKLGISHSQRCGVDERKGMHKVVGGENVTSQVYPWFVALSTTGSGQEVTVVCAGSLIAPKFVLTAAHCYAEYAKSKWLSVYKLLYRLENRCEPGDRVSNQPQASKVEIHKRYRRSGLMYDIALITLATKVRLTPICLPSPNMKSFEGEVIGFGSDVPRIISTYPCQLQRAKLPILSKRQCLRTGIGPTVRSLSGVICAGRTQGGVDTCDGDSGGPLQVNANGRFVIRGIVSFGYGCARKDMPGVYTDVVSYLEWIRPRVQERNSKSPNRPQITLPGLNIPPKLLWIING